MRDGSPAERAVAAILREAGYLVASRRHEPGPGDHLAISAPMGWGPLLIETKGGRDPWENFRPRDRRAMLAANDYFGVEPLLAYVMRLNPPEVMFLPESDWPA